MIKIFDSLSPFMEDNYARINVREYSRKQAISPPTASKLLKEYQKQGLLLKEIDQQSHYFYANRESHIFVDISRLYWRIKLERSLLLQEIEKIFLNPVIVLFGSLSKAEAKSSSDIDLAIFSPTKTQGDLSSFEKRLGRKIQVFVFADRFAVDSPLLLNNILNGYKLRGMW